MARWVSLAGLVLVLSSAAHATIPTVHLCQSDEGDYPWTLADRPGLNNLLIERAARRSNVIVRFHPMPWARCLFKTSTGEMDGVVAASFRPERMRIGVYPMRDGAPDADHSLMRNQYLLYRRKDDPQVQWDGQTLQVNGLIGVQTGYSIANTLRKLGAMIRQNQRLPGLLLDDLLEGHLRAVALTAGEGQRLLADNPVYAQHLEALPVPLEKKDFYLVLSRQFQRQHPELTEQLWQHLKQEQRSAGWQAEVARFR